MPNEIDTPNSDNRLNQGSHANPRDASGIVRHSTCWMRPPFGQGEPKEVEATPSELVPLMIAGWSQCAPSAAPDEVKQDVHD
jgi:hypothetical protein